MVNANIVDLSVDCVVNAANSNLAKGKFNIVWLHRILLGGGVCGVIHDAAGSELEIECKKLGGAINGEVKATKSYNLEPRIKGKNVFKEQLFTKFQLFCMLLVLIFDIKRKESRTLKKRKH